MKEITLDYPKGVKENTLKLKGLLNINDIPEQSVRIHLLIYSFNTIYPMKLINCLCNTVRFHHKISEQKKYQNSLP